MRLMVRLPFLRNFPARLIGFGIRTVRIKDGDAPTQGLTIADDAKT